MRKVSPVRPRIALLISTGAIALLLPHAASGQSTPAPRQEAQLGSDYAPGDIIITAQKRQQTLRDVPQSVSVVSQATLERQQAATFQDYLGMIPGLSLQQPAPGNARLVLRGINTGGVSSTVAVYVDDVPFGSSSALVNGSGLAGDLDTFDVARIEVLRGPQGTLYGASSLGGVLKFVTNAPDPNVLTLRAKGGVETTKGGELGYNGAAVANVPLASTLAVRATGYYRKSGGYIDSIGTAGSLVKKDVNGATVYGGRVSALFSPSSALSIQLTANLQNIDARTPSGVDADANTYEPLYGQLTHAVFVPEHSKTNYRIYSGTVGLDLGFAKLSSVSSYATLDRHFLLDETAIARAVGYGAYCPSTPAVPLCNFANRQQNRVRKFTQEVRLASNGKSTIDWLGGGYYTRETGLVAQAFNVLDPADDRPTGPFGTLQEIGLHSKYREYAAFANATWHITHQFDVTFGGRYSHNSQDSQQSVIAVGTSIPYAPEKSSESVFTYSIAPRFQINRNVAVYARVAKGYRPGGPNVVPVPVDPTVPLTFKSDSTVNYEAGIKADMLNRALSIDLSAFYIDWTRIQLFEIVNSTGVNTNGTNAVSKGLEATLTMRPTTGLNFSLNASVTDAHLKADTTVGGLKGDPLPYTPKNAVNFNGDYEWAAGGHAKAFVGGTIRLVGQQIADYDPIYRPAHMMQRKLQPYDTVDLRAGVDFGKATLEVYARNLTNSRGVIDLSGIGGGMGLVPNGGVSASYVRPRTIGLSLTVGY